MPYLNQYRYTYSQKIGSSSELIQVTLYQKSSEGIGTPTITTLVAGESPFRISIIDNDKNKYTPIRGKQAHLIFKPQTAVTANTFSNGPDDEWIVEALVVSTGFILFKGFLVMDDHQQSFLPVSHQYDIELTATDNLGTLKEVPLSDDSGNYIRGYKKLIEIIAQCLRKTGLQLDIIVTDTWMEESQTTFMTALNYVYLNAGYTFCKQINSDGPEAVNCYEALETIFKYWLSIKQYNGQWWIDNVNDKTGGSVYKFRFDYTGTYIDSPTPTTYSKTIGRTHNLKLINKDAIVTFTRPYKFTKLSVNYQSREELPDNGNFSRGTWLSVIDLGNPLWLAYSADDWTMVKTSGSVTSTAYIVRKFKDTNHTYEDSRYLRILPASSSASPWDHLRSNAIPITQKDKAVVSVDFRYESADTRNAATGRYIFTFYIQTGTSYYFYNQSNNRWQGPLSITGANYGVLHQWDSTNFDETEWQTVSVELPPFPVDGNLFVGLFNGRNFDTTAPTLNYTNLQFNYIPYINGDYSRYSGHSNKIEQSGNYKANIDETVTLGDSPKPLFKNSMFKLVGGNYVLTQRWFAGGDLLNQALIPPYPPSDIYLHPFGFLQIQAVWNQYNRRMIGLQGSVKGLDMTTTDVPDLIHTYTIDAVTPEVDYTKKRFVLVGMEQDKLEKEQWSATLEETADSDISKDYSTPVQFKYEGGAA